VNKVERWVKQTIPTQNGKTAVITGANSGIGFEAAKILARQGAHVVLAVRDEVKGGKAAREIRSAAPQADLEVMALDLANLAAVRGFAAKFMAGHARLDMLINNAGVMAIPQRATADGFEMQFGTNHLGHFALTGLLLPVVLKTPKARVVTVSSNMHKFGRIDFDNLQGERGYSKWGSYSQSKLANLLFAYELQRRLAAAGASAISVAAHPGYAATNLQAVGPDMDDSKIQKMSMSLLNRVVAQSAEMGALPTVYATAAPDVHGGDYVGPSGIVEQRGWPKTTTSSGPSRDEAAAVRLWTLSEQLTGVAYVFDEAHEREEDVRQPAYA
jgi:NAD(P)-dependent dehydrogenase (short-subunit alcohol dehydrogenase family)